MDEMGEILRRHGLWLRGESEGSRAVLSGAVLRGANLRDAVLRGADLRGANLRDGRWTKTPPHGAVGRWTVLAWDPDRIQVGCTTISGEKWLGETGERLARRNSLLPWERAGIRALIEAALADTSWWEPNGTEGGE